MPNSTTQIMISIRTAAMSIFWWMYVAMEKFILERTPGFNLTSGNETLLNALGIVTHLILIFFISSCFSMIRYRRGPAPLKDVMIFSSFIILTSMTMDMLIGASWLYNGDYTPVMQWYVWAGYGVCLASTILFSKHFFFHAANHSETMKQVAKNVSQKIKENVATGGVLQPQ